MRSPAPEAETGPSPYADVSAEALALRIFPRTLNPERFSIWSQSAGCLGRFQVELTVIGASHLVVIKSGDREFSELFACHAAGEDGASFFAPLPELTGAGVALDDGGYRFSAEVVELLGVRDLPSELRPDGELVAAARFPGLPGRPDPETLIAANRSDEARLTIESVHWYETEGLCVRSRSSIEL